MAHVVQLENIFLQDSYNNCFCCAFILANFVEYFASLTDTYALVSSLLCIHPVY